MARTRLKHDPPAAGRSPYHFSQRLKEIDMFFQGRGSVHKTMRRLVRKLEKAKIPYAIVGGMAVNAHRYQRTPGDVNVLLTAEGFAEFRRRFVDKDYGLVPGRKKRFVDQASQVTLDVLVTGHFPGTGRPGPVAYPDPAEVSESIDDIRVVNLGTLIQLKLAARRHRDFGDVVELIRVQGLDKSFAERLDPSLRQDYVECLEEMRREEAYQAREG
jgi:hypothetical protein